MVQVVRLLQPEVLVEVLIVTRTQQVHRPMDGGFAELVETWCGFIAEVVSDHCVERSMDLLISGDVASNCADAYISGEPEEGQQYKED